MPLNCTREKQSDTAWKIFHAADSSFLQKYSHISKLKTATVYEDFRKVIRDRGKSSEKITDCEDLPINENLDKCVANLFDSICPEKNGRGVKSGESLCNPESGAQTPIDDDYDSDSNNEDLISTSRSYFSQPDSNPNEESDVSEYTTDLTEIFDEYTKKAKSAQENKTSTDTQEFVKCLSYTNLTKSLMGDYRSRSLRDEGFCNEEAMRANRYLDEYLPLIQVLDVLQDVNKVLKTGKLTPQMERIIEYKQNHPFTFGYDEEELGWCPWLCFKIEQFLNKFWSTQWPFY